MTNYSLADYGPDPRNPWLENYANGWGSENCWPNGVPPELLGNARTADGTAITVRRELIDLFDTLHDLTERGYEYLLTGGGYTGGYHNRPIGSTATPSAHSRGRAVDYRAQDNPQSRTFTSTWPPSAIHAWESCGFYWGGRYVGAPYDTMHLSYIGTPDDVPGHLAQAQHLRDAVCTGSAPTPTPGQAPAPGYPLPDGQVFGLITGPNWMHGGHPSDPESIRAHIRWIQRRLIETGCVIGVDDPHSSWADGVFEEPTAQAVRWFQAARGIKVDGIVGTATWRELQK